jgi:hypothetical protein
MDGIDDGGLNFTGIHVGGRGDRAETNATICVVDSRTDQGKLRRKCLARPAAKG